MDHPFCGYKYNNTYGAGSAVVTGSDRICFRISFRNISRGWHVLLSVNWTSSPYRGTGITYTPSKCIAVFGSSPFSPWKPVDIKLYMVLCPFWIFSSIAATAVGFDVLVTPTCTALSTLGIGSSPGNSVGDSTLLRRVLLVCMGSTTLFVGCNEYSSMLM